ncbi:MAG TPA: MFS transporter [Candidatus Thermoplasmatota archaeon]|nr:MFS transporter [Candidatus Thermoplasmatota archaeon]
MKEQGRILWTVGIIHAINDGSIAVVSVLFPVFRELFHLSYTEVGIITGGGLSMTLIGQLAFGRIADGKNVNSFLLTGLLLTGLSMFLLMLSHSYLTLILFMLVLRFATSLFHPIGVGWVSRTYKRQRLDWAMGIQSGSADIGTFFAIATTLTFSALWGWGFPLALWGIIGIGGLSVCILLTRELERHWMIVPNAKSKQTLRDASADTWRLVKKIKLLVPAFVISGASWGITITFLPLLLNARTTISLPIIGLLVAMWTGIGSLSSLSYGRIRKKINRKKVLVLSYFGIGIMGIFLSYFTNVFIIIPVLILLGISVFLTYPALFSFVSEVTHETKEGWTFGITFTFQTGGSTVLSFFSGFLSDVYGIWVPFALVGMISFIFGVVLLFNYSKPFCSVS